MFGLRAAGRNHGTDHVWAHHRSHGNRTSGARVHPTAVIGAYCIVEDEVEIGPHNRLDPFAIVEALHDVGRGQSSLLRRAARHRPDGQEVSRGEFQLPAGGQSQRVARIRQHFARHQARRDHRARRRQLCDEQRTHRARLPTGQPHHHRPSTSLGGYAEIEDSAFLSAGVGVHQFSKVGRLSMVAANTRVAQDVPPYLLVSEFDCAAHGLNLVGLRRSGASRETVSTLKQAYRLLYRSGCRGKKRWSASRPWPRRKRSILSSSSGHPSAAYAAITGL